MEEESDPEKRFYAEKLIPFFMNGAKKVEVDGKQFDIEQMRKHLDDSYKNQTNKVKYAPFEEE